MVLKRGVIFLLDDSTAWYPIHFGDMFSNHLSCEGIEWNVMKIASGDDEITPSTLAHYDCFVLTGSRFNCRDRDTLPWFDSLCTLIQDVSLNPDKRMYGGCFGCQIVSHALGGVVDYNPNKRFVLLAETIRFTSLAEGFEAAQSFISPPADDCLKVIVSHGDCVIQLPQGCHRIARSDSCEHEIYIAGPHKNILCMQSHPEFDYDYAIRDRIWPAVVERNKRLNEEEIARSKESFEAFGGRHCGSDQLIMMIKAFLLARLPSPGGSESK